MNVERCMMNAGILTVQHSALIAHHLPRFRAHQFAVAILAGPVSVHEGHGIAAEGTVGRRSLVEDGQGRKLDIQLIVLSSHALPA